MGVIDDMILVQNNEIVDLQIENGDLKIADATNQSIYGIIKAQKGQFYQHPTLGVGIADYENAAIDKRIIAQQIRENLKADDFRILTLDVSANADGISINLEAIKST